MKRRLVIRGSGVDPYAPANHTGTANRRVICEETVGARKIEILIGSIEKGHGAHAHAHPQLEQLGYFLSGSGISEVDGETQETTVGTWSFLPKGSFHRFTVTSEEPVQLFVIYAPPYGENRALTVLQDEGVVSSTAGGRRLSVPTPVPEYGKTSVLPIITHETVNADHVEVHLATIWPEFPLRRDAEFDAEQVLYVAQGSLQAEIGDEEIQASQGDWVFVPPGCSLVAVALGTEVVKGFLIRGIG